MAYDTSDASYAVPYRALSSFDRCMQVELAKHEPRWYEPYLWYDYVETVDDHSVHFVVIDTEALEYQMNNYTLMETWLNDTLAASTADWKIVVGHRNIFSAGVHGPVTTSTLVKKSTYTDDHYSTAVMYVRGGHSSHAVYHTKPTCQSDMVSFCRLLELCRNIAYP